MMADVLVKSEECIAAAKGVTTVTAGAFCELHEQLVNFTQKQHQSYDGQPSLMQLYQQQQ